MHNYAEGKPENLQACRELSWQPNWEMVIKLVRNIPGKDEDEIINM